MYHVPVMLDQCMEGLDLSSDGVYVDLTFGGGGHSAEILRRLGPEGRLLGFDQDADAEAVGRRLEQQDGRFTFVRANFRFVVEHLHYRGITAVDGILADLGVSSHQFDETDRGFSFRGDAPIDMRMNAGQALSADTILREWGEQELSDIFRLYGELKQARRVARAIVARRDGAEHWTTSALVDAVLPTLDRAREKKDMARVFQALRIAVNGEMDALGEMLASTADVIRPGGRLVVMTYHSLEDRIVKNYVRTGSVEGRETKDFYGRVQAPFRDVNRGVTVPSDEEQIDNPRSRSAKLRVAERVS